MATVSGRSSKPFRERLGQTVGLLVFGLLILRQLSLFPVVAAPTDLLRWFLLTLFFVLAVSAYAVRRPARVLARGPLDVVLPLVCAGLPLMIAEIPSAWTAEISLRLQPLGITPQRLWHPRFREGAVPGIAIAALGEAIMTVGLFELRRSFSIFTEARELVTTGIYRYVRHPLYAGEIATVWGIVLSWPSLWAAAIGALFTALQLWRAKREERLLAETFPEYADYRVRAGLLWPRRNLPGR